MNDRAKLKTIIALDIEVLSPLHIGTGKVLQRGYDYTLNKNRTWRINEEALFQEVYSRTSSNQKALNKLLQASPAEDLIEPDDYTQHPEFFRYHMPGQPRAEGKGAEMRECLKTSYDQPYIPGSSLKGALRTVLARSIVQKEAIDLNKIPLKDNRSWAGQTVEQKIFGNDPNHDLLRALQVGDSSGATKDTLLLANVQVVAGTHYQSPIEVEAIRPGTHVTAQLVLDEYLLDQARAEQLGWSQRRDYLRKLAMHSRNWAGARIKTELNYLGDRKDLNRLADFYRLLERLRSQLKGSEDFLLQISWGGGWNAKTLGDQLSANPDQLEKIIDRYRLSKSRERRPGDTFPRSRRIYFDRTGPAMPMGWVLVRTQTNDL
ncbi:MAG: type III-A CRISPR-associated RAMP protein Csm5 [Caldilineales bacterium]